MTCSVSHRKEVTETHVKMTLVTLLLVAFPVNSIHPLIHSFIQAVIVTCRSLLGATQGWGLEDAADCLPGFEELPSP